MADQLPDYVMRALIDDRMAQLQADKDTELEEYLAALPTPIHLIIDMAELEAREQANEEAAREDQRQLLHHEVQADACRRRLALGRIEKRELFNRRRGLERNV